MGTIFCILILGYWLHRLAKATPGAIRFGLENQEALRGGASVLKRIFGK